MKKDIKNIITKNYYYKKKYYYKKFFQTHTHTKKEVV